MAQADPGAVHVHTIPVQSELALTAEVLGGKGLIHFNQLKIRQGKTRLGRRFRTAGHGAEPHDGGMTNRRVRTALIRARGTSPSSFAFRQT